MKRVLIGIAVLLVVVVVVVIVALRASLPLLEGRRALAGLTAPVAIVRDSLGVPTVRGRTRLDVARATGFVHAQDRFFQMDLLRRDAAGELAALVGVKAVERDRQRRLHRLRAVAARAVEQASEQERALLNNYSEGVNAGLSALAARPFEYLLLRATPEPWRPDDTMLAIFAMYFQLHDETGILEAQLGTLRDVLPAPVFEFLAPAGTEWDAPLIGPSFPQAPVPEPESCDLRNGRPGTSVIAPEHRLAWDEEPNLIIGSNNWAVAGTDTASRDAILANDMHLGLRVPNVWYRMRLVVEDQDIDVTGATLPGTPVIVIGSNRHVAWGFTNSRGDWVDLIILELDQENPNRYRTSQGYRSFESQSEIIEVKAGEEVELRIQSTIWGPVIAKDHRGRPIALRWTAHEPGATNVRLIELESARDVHDAIQVAHRIGIPPQNLVVADADGNIAWTIIGRIPRRKGYDSRYPTSWANGDAGWIGWLAGEDYPSLINPPSGRIWTANARTVDGPSLDRVSDGGYALGARAKQIRDRLMAIERATIPNMMAIQLDDRSLFLDRWRRLLLDVLTPEAITADSKRGELRRHAEAWNGHASVDSVGYRMIREFRLQLLHEVLTAIVEGCSDGVNGPINFERLQQSEGPLWALVTARPPHLLNPRYQSWQQQLLAGADRALESCANLSLDECTWGAANPVDIVHPLSRAVPILGRWLDVHHDPLPGGKFVPRVQKKAHGASERFAVSPGKEAEGYFHMPGGQGGHPLSRFYRAGHDAWAKGEPLPFLPGETVYELELHPTSSR